ncbi:MAG: flagellar hook-associated protein FlgK [Bacillota bacterium]|nr:flagellar hook-associated protein FlgK [Bacillota bacterium]MDW7683025.1 flagellar hook-associated protein FlgK [Bacillota bacterium]
MSTFTGLNISRLGMMAQQKSLEVTSHNVANANTPGYSRQVAHMTPTTPLPYPNGKGMLGSGVLVDEVARVRDRFLDSQIRQETQTLAKWETGHYFLGQIENVFMEPSETGFNKVLSTFFDSWQELSLNPEGTPVRSALIENANALTNSVRHTFEQLKTIRNDMSEQIDIKVNEVNTLAEQLKDLNRQIVSLTVQGNNPADLLDRRDLLLEELSEIIEFDAVLNQNGSVNLYLGGRALVYENTSFVLKTLPGGNDPDTGWPLSPKIAWERDDREVNMKNGQLAGIIETRDVNLKKYMEDFESMVWGVVNAVNDIHESGSDLHGDTNVSFFNGTHLETLHVNEDIAIDPSRIAAALAPPPGGQTSAPGDGRNAVLIAQLRREKISVDTNPATDLHQRVNIDPDGTTTFENYYRDTIARIGTDTQESDRMAQNQGALLAMLGQRKDSISGVSMDEEMANMVQFQLAYQASAQVITTFDEIYDTLINRMLR